MKTLLMRENSRMVNLTGPYANIVCNQKIVAGSAALRLQFESSGQSFRPVYSHDAGPQETCKFNCRSISNHLRVNLLQIVPAN